MFDTLTKLLNRPLTIGTKTIPNRLILAPMTFLGHIAFRQVLDELGGCGLMYSEMCSAGRIPTEDRYTSPYFRWRDEESGYLAIQILGNKPARMALAAQRIEDEGLWGVDINLGCSTKTICKHNLGAALLKDMPTTLEMIRTIRKAIRCPLTVKFRTGWHDSPDASVEFARRLEDLGVDALIYHPRVAPDRRSRPPRWEYIGLVKAAVRIPVFGNGNVFNSNDCLRMLRQTGCDGIALGRAAIARPWIFSQWTQQTPYGSDLFQRVALRLSALLQRHYDPKAALRRFKRYCPYLAANFAFGNSLYNAVRNAADMHAIDDAVKRFFESPRREMRQPNMNFFQ